MEIKEQIAALPLSPGVYQFINRDGEVIYVGKAKSLRKRVSSYFANVANHSAKVRIMVRHICFIEHIVVESEGDALLLENSLIKELQPRYNILLKDDKSYPWIVVVREPFPRILSTRRLMRDGSAYFGPFSSISMQRSILDFIADVIPLRTCKLNLSQSAIARGRYGVCLQYHIGNCLAPCVGNQSEEEYQRSIELAISVLKGDLRPVRNYLNEQMSRAVEELRFEVAKRCKQRLEALDNYAHRSVIVSSKIVDVDLFSLLCEDEEVAYCNYIKVRHGSIVALYTVEINVGIEHDQGAILASAIEMISEKTGEPLAREVIVSTMPTTLPIFDRVNFTVPKRGEKMDLLNYSLKSARLYRAEQRKLVEMHNPERHADRLMEAMRKELNLEREPRHIECFDNSNLQGTNPVASCVVFRDGKPSKREYRHFNIRTVEGIDDFASMREIIHRRYSRLIADAQPLPDLIIVDGGKGQLSSGYKVLCELGIEDQVAMVGLAKRIEEVFYPNDPMPYYLSRKGEPLKVVCHIRDEAHRFAITHHRKQRSKDFITSELDGIKGVGSKSVTALLKAFGSVAGVRAATLEQLSEVVSKSRAEVIKTYFEG